MKLYGFPFSPNTRRVQMMLHEVNAEHEFVPVDLTQGAHRSPDYLALNPNGRVPCLVDQDFVLWESNAILQYLAARFPERHLDGERPRERAEVACWLFMNAAHLSPAVAHIFAHTMRLPEEQRVAQIAQNGRTEAARCLGVLEGQLASRPFLAGNHFTIADVSVAATLSVAGMIGLDLSPYPKVSAYMAEIEKRPSYRKVFGLGAGGAGAVTGGKRGGGGRGRGAPLHQRQGAMGPPGGGLAVRQGSRGPPPSPARSGRAP